MEDGYVVDRRLQFVSNYEWIWNIKMTRLFVDSHLLKIPQEWRDSMLLWEPYGTVNSVATTVCKAEPLLPQPPVPLLPQPPIPSVVPESMRDYITQCIDLSLSQLTPDYIKTNEIIVDKNITRGMSPKKLHEVSRLSGLVKQVCQDTKCDSVIDVGSGLGYLGSCLVSQCGLNVTCIERNEDRVDSAIIREKKLFKSCDSHMTTVSMSIDCSTQSRVSITKLIESLSVPRVSLIGLHCCGDLTPTLLSLMTTPPHTSLTSAVIVPCCYHKMSTINEQTITNFPLSQYYKRKIASCTVVSFNTFALRLAAQEPLVNWQSLSSEAHYEHMKRVAYRAVLETLLVETDQSLSSKTHRKANYDNFENYFKSISDEIKGLTLEHAMRQYNKFSHLFPLIEPFTALQYYMQRVLETIVLTDQTEYLKEAAGQQLSVELVPVFDVNISPRCFAIVAKTKC